MRRSVLLIVILAMCAVLGLAVPENAAKAQRGQASVLFVNRTERAVLKQAAKRGVIHAPRELFVSCPLILNLPKGEKLWSMDVPVVTEVPGEGAPNRRFRGYTLQMKPLLCVQEH